SFDRAWQRILRGRQRLCRNHQLLDRVRLILRLFRRLELRWFLHRYRDLVLAGQLGLPRRFLHLIAAATTATTRTRFGEPDDLVVRLVWQKGFCAEGTRLELHQQNDEDDSENVQRYRRCKRQTETLGLDVEEKRNFRRVILFEVDRQMASRSVDTDVLSGVHSHEKRETDASTTILADESRHRNCKRSTSSLCGFRKSAPLRHGGKRSS